MTREEALKEAIRILEKEARDCEELTFRSVDYMNHPEKLDRIATWTVHLRTVTDGLRGIGQREEALASAIRILRKKADMGERAANRPRDWELIISEPRWSLMMAHAKHLRDVADGLEAGNGG